MSIRLASRVLLIGWDAADWQMINPLLEKGLMPNLKRLIDNGIMGNISTLSPIISPILWNSIATGKHGDRHGILSFVEPDGKGNIRPVCSTSRQAKAIWNILSQNGMTSNVINWYASHPAERVRGAILTDRYCRFDGGAEHPACDENAIHPQSIREDMLSLRVSANDITAEQILPFIPKAHLIDQEKDQLLAAFCMSLAECATVHNAATYLMEETKWDFTAIYYDMIDHLGHGFMPFHPPKMDGVKEDMFEIYKQVMGGTYCWHDMMLGRLMQLAGDDTNILLISDHGFYNDSMRPIDATETEAGVQFGPAKNPVAWHRPFGIFCAYGPSIKKDELAHGVSLLDITPTILTTLGLPVGRDMDGKTLTQIFTEAPTVEFIETHEGDHPDDGVFRGEMSEDPYSAQIILENLARLGYIDAPGGDQAEAVHRTILDRKHNLAHIYYSTTRFAKALELFEELMKVDDSPHLRARVAMCMIQLQRLDDAEVLLRDLAGMPATHPLVAIVYSQILTSKGRPEEALKLLRSVQKSGARSPRWFLQMGHIHNLQKKFVEAEEMFRKVLDIDPEDPEAHDALGVALRGQGRTEDAVHHHMKSASLLHARAETHINLGSALAELKQIDWAIQAFKVAAELAPRHPFPHRCLAKLYHKAKLDFDQARYHMQMAAKLRKKLDDVGIIAVSRGDAMPR